MIKVIKGEGELSEARLNEMEAEGMVLISANCAVTNEYSHGPMAFKHDVTRWTYHFRVADKKSSGPSPYDASAPRRRKGRFGPRD